MTRIRLDNPLSRDLSGSEASDLLKTVYTGDDLVNAMDDVVYALEEGEELSIEYETVYRDSGEDQYMVNVFLGNSTRAFNVREDSDMAEYIETRLEPAGQE